MGKAFAPSVAGGGDAHQAGVLAVLHIAHQHPILDQDILARRGAFVVDGDRSATVGNGAVIQHGHAFGGDLFSHKSRESRGFLAVEVAFQPVADGFVQQDSGPAGAKDHVHSARRGLDRGKVHAGDAEGFGDHGFPGVG